MFESEFADPTGSRRIKNEVRAGLSLCLKWYSRHAFSPRTPKPLDSPDRCPTGSAGLPCTFQLSSFVHNFWSEAKTFALLEQVGNDLGSICWIPSQCFIAFSSLVFSIMFYSIFTRSLDHHEASSSLVPLIARRSFPQKLVSTKTCARKTTCFRRLLESFLHMFANMWYNVLVLSVSIRA